jgi:2-methylcitrate dehydratase
MDKTISGRIADFATSVTYSDLPDEVVAAAKRFMYDSIGCGLGGVDTEDCAIARKALLALGGKPECTIIGTGEQTDAVNAALLNALLIRVHDYNDIYWKSDPSHPSDIIPAALSLGEREGKSGKDLLVAVALAYEFEMRLCEICEPGIREIGWHHATLTGFVSPIAAGRMLDLTAEQMQHAIAISGCRTGSMGCVTAGTLTMMKNTVDPLATQAGVQSALLAQGGYKGTAAVFEGKEGVHHCYPVKWDWDALFDGLGEKWRLPDCSMKAFPTEYFTHSPITATLQLVKEHDLKPDDVKELTVYTLARAADILCDPSKYIPSSKETADHSLPYCLAVAMADREVTPRQFKDKRRTDPALPAIMKKVKGVADPEIEKQFPELQPARVVIETTDGRKLEHRVDYAMGDPRQPIDDTALDGKFSAQAEDLLTEQKQRDLKDAIFNLDAVSTVADLMALTVKDK